MTRIVKNIKLECALSFAWYKLKQGLKQKNLTETFPALIVGEYRLPNKYYQSEIKILIFQ